MRLKNYAFFGCVLLIGCVSAQNFQFVEENEVPELLYLNKSANPCDNFYEFTCGNFDKQHPMPKDAINWDHFTILQEEIHNISQFILSSPRKKGDPVGLKKAKAFYQACVNVEYSDELRLPQLDILSNLGDWPAISTNPPGMKLTWEEIGDIIAEYGVPLFFQMQVIPSNFDRKSNVLYISRDPLKNPEPGIIPEIEMDWLNLDLDQWGYHLQDSVKRDTKKLPFLEFLDKMAFRFRNLMGFWKSNRKIEVENAEAFEFMRKLSLTSSFRSNGTVSTLPSEATINQLQNWTNIHFGEEKGLDWISFLNHAFKYSGVKVNGTMKIFHSLGTDMIYSVINLYNTESAEVIKNFIVSRLLTYMAPDSDSYIREIFETFYKKQNYNVYARSEYCLRKTLGYSGNVDFSMAVAYEYQRYHFNVNKLKNAIEMIEDLHEAFLNILDDATWMDDASKVKAKNKANNIITLLGFPDYAEKGELLDRYYENLRVCSWDHFGNSQRLRAFRHASNMKLLGENKDREIWNLSPLEVNAFYNRANNRILFPVSVLNPVFFTGEISLLDYARIGAIIGHEMTHGFDAAGKLYNDEGLMANWWTKETENAFKDRSECFRKQYFRYFIDEIKEFVNGNKTLNENIADNGGLRAAYKAFRRLQNRETVIKTVKEFSPEQMFFIGYGTMWCMSETDSYLDTMHEKGVHSPGRFRVVGTVSNMEEFSEAFNCPADSDMNAKDKCLLW